MKKKYIRKVKCNLSIYEINRKTKKDNIMFYDVNVHNNRAIDYGQIGRLTVGQANIALQYFNYRCAFSGEKFINFNKATQRKIKTKTTKQNNQKKTKKINQN